MITVMNRIAGDNIMLLDAKKFYITRRVTNKQLVNIMDVISRTCGIVSLQ